MTTLRARVQAQAWARAPISFPFGAASDLEPVGWEVGGVGVFDVPTALGVQGRFHRGTDFGLWTGAPVTVALSGRVTWADTSNLGYGRLVTIEGSRYKCRYSHLSTIEAELGEWLDAGTELGLSGATGNVTGAHLHFEVFDKRMGCYIDPLRGM